MKDINKTDQERDYADMRRFQTLYIETDQKLRRANERIANMRKALEWISLYGLFGSKDKAGAAIDEDIRNTKEDK